MLARREGMLLGGSTGTNLAAALRYARRLGPEHLVVTIGCDTGRNYLSKFFDDAWLAENKLTSAAAAAQSIGDLIKKRGPRQLVKITPDATAEKAIGLLEATGISQLPVIAADGKAVGSVQEVTLARLLHDRRDPNTVKIGEVMARPLPTLDIHTHLDEAYRMLMAGYTGVLATENDVVVDIVTRIDLIHYWDQTRKK
jgi:cystathionine beta-synthase